jgi:hypothetical protein
MGVFDFLSEGMKTADNIAERTAINAAFFGMAPDWLVTDIQNTMRSIGIPLPSSISPSGISQLGATTLVIGGILAAIVTIILRFAYGIFQRYMLFAISMAIIITGIVLYETDKITPLRTLLRWVETASYFALMGVIAWIIIWLIGIKQIYFFEKGPKSGGNDEGPSLPMVTFGLAVFLVLSITILLLVEAFVPSFESNYKVGDYVWSNSYILLGVPLILILIEVWRMWKGVSGKEKGRAKDSLLTTLFNTFPLVDIFKNVGLMERIEHLKKGYVIGPKSLTMFRMGWTALFLFVATIITIKAIPELDSFIGKITENFTNKIREGFTSKKNEDDEDDDEDVEEPFVDKTAVAEGPTDSEQVTLVNIQPVSVKQAGYMGPKERGGSFETDITVINAIREGVRFFVLQIDYLEKAPGGSGFDPINVPTLLYRDDKGALISKNGASIADIAKKLSTYAFNADFPSNTQPLIVYLHFVRTPDLISSPNKYLKYMMDVAAALQPIQSLILNKHDSTDFTRQKNERVLLYSPLKNFEKKILLWTNADTSVFRSVEKLSIAPIALNQDLDYMVSMRVYLDNSKDTFGITTVAPDTAYAVIVPFKRLKGMKDKRGVTNKEKQDFAMKGKTRFVIAMPGQTEEVTQADIDKVLKTTGVNTVPMNLFGKSAPSIKSQLTLWGGATFFRMKPALIQSSKAAVAGYTPPPNVLNRL